LLLPLLLSRSTTPKGAKTKAMARTMARGMARNLARTMPGNMSRARGSAEAKVRLRAGTKAKLLSEAGDCTLPGECASRWGSNCGVNSQ
jgi:hypothetical protein